MKLDGDLFFAALFDRTLQLDLVAVDRYPVILLKLFFDISGRHGTESLSGFAGFEREFELQFSDLAREILGIIELTWPPVLPAWFLSGSSASD